MGKRIIKLCCLASATAALASCSSSDEPPAGGAAAYANEIVEVETVDTFSPTAAEATANKAINDFAFRFFNEVVARDGAENVAVSPMSASIQLSMAANSLDDDFEQSVKKVLGVDDMQTVNSLTRKLVGYLSKDRHGGKIRLANSVWYADRLAISPDYVDEMHSDYFAEVNAIDFTAPGTPAAIDGWVSTKTEGAIPQISDNIVFSDQVSAMLVNSILFNSEWSSKFLKEDNSMQTFHGSGSEKVTEFMNSSNSGFYKKSNGAELTKLFFKAGAEIIFAMPEEGVDFTEFCKNLSGESVAPILNGLTYLDQVNLTLSLPKFKNSYDLKRVEEVYGKMGLAGMTSALTKMGVAERNFCSIAQRTVVDTDEEGIKLAAVTYMMMTTAAHLPDPTENVSLTLDRPFVYIVKEYSTGSILMIGTVTDFD